ncbi:MAG: SDR family NAD(P)-dependent oxidoreductase [Rhodovarius sp.]|nr:SDR family oxidoreductase [Rhodovarius sp.]MCX7932171.1 SDR family oxidoreductase [Rhodovarius sp.]MDW8315782.1 SDR family NAD(P)-dependent oxidoreductase [Rhodovarius sp.]
MNRQRFLGKVAVVTGAGSVGPGWGNGRAIAVGLAEEGALVFGLDRDPAAMEETAGLIAERGGRFRPMACDVTRSGEVAQAIAAIRSEAGGIQVLVNNVGGSAPGGPVALSEEEWDSQIDLNLKSVFLLCKHVIPVMLEGGGGAIVNLASTSGIRWTGSAQVAYAAAKAGVIQLSRVVAVEYAARGIRVNTVVPGQMHTPMVEARLARQRMGGDVAALLESRRRRIPLGFAGDGRDTAAAVLFLASEEARFITGTELVVDGGMSARCD